MKIIATISGPALYEGSLTCDTLHQAKNLVKLQIANDDSIFRVLHAKKMDVVPLFVILTKFINFQIREYYPAHK